ncbi:serine/threonine-protein phosphatase BSL3-like [Magnolia sinica]|uniref:serine/threonine-protein phosphatase BSL3-like n=1 Tax=Magnolia sinica TaxID=86752 RepID=UPI002658A02D|nr:serine/threonine-protein phosphatase BSL3-like isoform X1 [Magnolia sinica]XP_058089254.1 serine/threonine-protein phosphatase BSL3-like isoform X1 [Magnolia sinica]XP_058089255.1 serine/threonine-protein phosphatase BSL3-like isoform X1 [Magnolia sinica]XP_058089259.1 serine/threonine-protein phosphatase BSL3-like [Magnolia sinica]XP_058089260.1 serine/threonine-protein phosphatase BSL3-like [Magnolia sinica]XP_058089261.1 serine/threonine-protein phosphatase BSL3-like [Magnolia sinica]XP
MNGLHLVAASKKGCGYSNCKQNKPSFSSSPFIYYTSLAIGVLLDDLLVAEDLAAAETTSAASHAAAAAAATNVQAGRLPARYTFVDERTRQEIPKVGVDGAVVLGSLVAPPINGICTPI